MPPRGAFGSASSSGSTIIYDKFGDTDGLHPPPAADDDAFVTSFATSASPVTKSGVGLNGVVGQSALTCPRPVTLTLAAAAGAYALTAIPIAGTDWNDAAISENLTPPDHDGGVTLKTTKCYKTVTSGAFPAQQTAGGHFKMGFADEFGFTSKVTEDAVGNVPLMAFYDGNGEASLTGIIAVGTGPTASPPNGYVTISGASPDGIESWTAIYVKAT